MGKTHNRKLQKQYQKEHSAAKQNKPDTSSSSKIKEPPGLVFKVIKVLLIMALPLLFGIFGLVMFPITSVETNNKTLSESFSKTAEQSPEGYCVGDNCPSATDSEVESSESTNDKRTPDTTTGEKMKSRTKSDLHPESDVPAEIRDFQATILDHLTIGDVDVEGRKIKAVELTSKEARRGAATRMAKKHTGLYQFDGFLSDRECDGLKRVHKRHIADINQQDPIICFDNLETLRKHLRDAGKNIRVSSKDFTEGTTCLNGSFSTQLKTSLHWSHSTSFYPGESKFSKTLEERIHQATGMLQINGGKFQITSYPKGIGYKTHTDCIIGHHDNRDRFATILVYLQDVDEGGETQFPELGISVTPKKGRAIVWNNMNSAGQCEPLSVHTAAQVKEGHKFIIQRWYYYKNFYQLGKRMPEPDLPSRSPGQPRVSCDEYEHGSCRWYDEWGYDHLIEYAAQKHSLKN